MLITSTSTQPLEEIDNEDSVWVHIETNATEEFLSAWILSSILSMGFSPIGVYSNGGPFSLHDVLKLAFVVNTRYEPLSGKAITEIDVAVSGRNEHYCCFHS